MADLEIVAFDLEGTLTAGVAWEGMRDYLVAHGEEGKYRRFFRKNLLPVLAFRFGLLRVESMGTAVEFVDGRFTGEIIGQLNVGQAKVARLQQAGRLVAAYGDTLRDIPMLELAETAVAVHPDAILQETAVQRGWRILTS